MKIANKTGWVEEFNKDLFFCIIEKMTVFEGKKVVVSLLDGTEIECVIE